MRMIGKRGAKETILRYAAEDLLNFRFLNDKYGFFQSCKRIFFTKEGCFEVNGITGAD